jgi:hypothetical protein
MNPVMAAGDVLAARHLGALQSRPARTYNTAAFPPREVARNRGGVA